MEHKLCCVLRLISTERTCVMCCGGLAPLLRLSTRWRCYLWAPWWQCDCLPGLLPATTLFDDLWVYEVASRPMIGFRMQKACMGLSGCYWIGHYWSESNKSAYLKHFVPIDPLPKPLQGASAVFKSFGRVRSQNRLVLQSRGCSNGRTRR